MLRAIAARLHTFDTTRQLHEQLRMQPAPLLVTGDLTRHRMLRERDTMGTEIRSVGEQWRLLGLGTSQVRAHLAEAVRGGLWNDLADDEQALDMLDDHLSALDRVRGDAAGAGAELLQQLEQAGVRTSERMRRQLAACARLSAGAALWAGPDMDDALSCLAERSDCDIYQLKVPEALARERAALARWIVADDLAEAIMQLTSGAPARITVACPDERLRHQLADQLARMGAAVLDRRRVAAHDLAVASALTALAACTDPQQLRQAAHLHAATLTEADALPLLESDSVSDQLVLLGRQLLARHGGRDEADWIEALSERLQGSRLPAGQQLAQLVGSTCTQARLHGSPDGIALASMSEAASLDSDLLVICGLEAGMYPPQQQTGAFGAAPARDWRTTARALTGAAPQLVFMRRAASAPSSLWTEWAVDEPELMHAAHSPRSRLRLAAQRGALGGEMLDAALALSTPFALPTGHFAGERNVFDVTELEQMLRCPAGWFVRYVLRPHGETQTLGARRGQLVHEALAHAMAASASERLAVLEARWLASASELMGDVHARAYLNRMRSVIERYAGADWPWDEHRLEITLEGAILPALPDVHVRGRLDRLDLGAPGPLVIDYKNRRGVQRPTLGSSQHELQGSLYPLLAENSFGQPAAGMIYISIFHGAHAGISRSELPGMDNARIAPILDAVAQQAIDQASEAIERIQQGDVYEVGTACPAWCPHRLLSDTAGLR